MTTRWLFTQKGEPAFYQVGQYLYTPHGGDCVLFENDGWFFKMNGGDPAYYVSNNWLFTPKGAPAYYYGDVT